MEKIYDANKVYAHTKGGNVLMYLITLAALVVYVTTGTGAVSVELAMVALMLGVVQQLWQGFALELITRQQRRLQREYPEGKSYGYPEYITTIDFMIYMMKMVVVVMAAVELILSL